MIVAILFIAYSLSHSFGYFICIGLVCVFLGASPMSILAMWLIPPRLVKGDTAQEVISLHLN
jgi:hypothetical protein